MPDAPPQFADEWSTVVPIKCAACHGDGWVWERGNLLKPEAAPRFGELDLGTGEFFDD